MIMGATRLLKLFPSLWKPNIIAKQVRLVQLGRMVMTILTIMEIMTIKD